MNCSFTFAHYGEIIQKALDEEYQFPTFAKYIEKKPKGKMLFLRHDIDNHFYRTNEFARVENNLGVTATYFFRVHTGYNIFEYNNYRVIKNLEAKGHEIGLHSEIGDFEKFNPGIDYFELLRREKRFIESCIGHEIKGFSTHRDLDYQVNSLDIIKEFDFKSLGFTYQAYQPEFHGEAKYLSETLNPHIGWREKCPCKYIGTEEKICILAHPAWWYNIHPREGE